MLLIYVSGRQRFIRSNCSMVMELYYYGSVLFSKFSLVILSLSKNLCDLSRSTPANPGSVTDSDPDQITLKLNLKRYFAD